MPTLHGFLNLASDLAQGSIIGLSVLLVSILLVVSDWRLAVGAFAALKVMAGFLLAQLLPPEWALLQWVTGGLMGVMWFLAARRVDSIRQSQSDLPWWRRTWRLNPSTLLRLSLLLILLVAAFVQQPVLLFPKLPIDLARFATFMALAGMVGLGLGDRPLRWGLSLAIWTLAANFVIHALQVDVDTVGLLAGLDILLGFVISYLIIADGARYWPRPEGA